MEFEEYKKHVDNASEILKALCHPTRFCIVCKLLKHPLNVSQMQSCLDISQANVSQHLSILRSRGIIKGEREGNEIFYSLSNEYAKQLVKVFFNESDIPE